MYGGSSFGYCWLKRHDITKLRKNVCYVNTLFSPLFGCRTCSQWHPVEQKTVLVDPFAASFLFQPGTFLAERFISGWEKIHPPDSWEVKTEMLRRSFLLEGFRTPGCHPQPLTSMSRTFMRSVAICKGPLSPQVKGWHFEVEVCIPERNVTNMRTWVNIQATLVHQDHCTWWFWKLNSVKATVKSKFHFKFFSPGQEKSCWSISSLHIII